MTREEALAGLEEVLGINVKGSADPARPDLRCGKWVSDNDPSGPMSQRCVMHNGHDGPCKGHTIGR
jgi:hypothetical protein